MELLRLTSLYCALCKTGMMGLELPEDLPGTQGRDAVEQMIWDDEGRPREDGFSLEKLRMLDRMGASTEQKFSYLNEFLKTMGAGSSRHVYALDEDRVIKLAMNDAGRKQNEAEIDVYTNPKTRPIIAKVYEASNDYSWIVSERAEPLVAPGAPSSSAKQIATEFGIDVMDLKSYLHRYKNMMGAYMALESVSRGAPPPRHLYGYYSDDSIESLMRQLDRYHQSVKSEEENIWGGEPPEFAKALALLVDYSELAHGDLVRDSSWGKTKDGRMVLIDYGATYPILHEYY